MCEITIGIISAAIALGSAIFAFWQARLAKKTLKIQQQIYEEGKPKLTLEIIESFLVDKKDEDKVYYYMNTIISNNSDKNNSIKSVALKVKDKTHTLNMSEVKNRMSEFEMFNFFGSPLNVDAHSSIKGWFVFELKRNIYNDLNPDSYFLETEDINNIKYLKEEILIREVVINYE
jgi:hypothetical protein